MGNMNENSLRFIGQQADRRGIINRSNSTLSSIIPPDSSYPQREPVIGVLPSEFLVQSKWSRITPIEESDVRPLIEVFKNPDILRTVHNDTFNRYNIPRNWGNQREVDRFAGKAKDFWMPKNPMTVKTIIPSIPGEEPPKNKNLKVNAQSFVVRVDRRPVHVFRVMDNDPFASQDEREKVDKEGSLKIAHQESMVTLPRFQRAGIAAFGTIQTYDALLGKNDMAKAPFDYVTILVNLAESNTANFFMNHGFEIFNLKRANENGGDVSQSVMMTNQDGEQMRMMRLLLTQKGWHSKRGERVEKLKRDTGIALP